MTITLRQESANGATTKGSALTYAELDNNFVHLLRQGSVTVRGDSGTDQTLGEADQDSILQFVGGTNVTTALSSDSAGETVITIDASAAGLSNIVEDTTPQLGGNLDAQNNNITSLGTLNTHTIPGGTGTFALTSQLGISNVVEDTTPQLGGDLDCQGNEIQNAVLEDYAETVYAIGSNDSPSISVSNGNVQTVTITSGLALPAFSDAATGQSVTLIVSGSGSLTGTGNHKFAEGNKTLTTDSVVSIFYDGTTYWTSVATNFSA